MKTKGDSGLSTLELLFWTLITAALLVIALPALAALSEEERVRLEAERLHGALHESRTQAEAFDRAVVMTIEPHQAEAYWGSRHGTRLSQLRVNNRVTLSVSSSKPNEVTFFRSGVATPATLLVRGDKVNCTLKVSLRGRITKSCHWAK